MIVMRLCGGLGNQMFQYALGRRLALEKKTSLRLDCGAFGFHAAPGDTPRSYRLNFFHIQAKIMPGWMSALMLPFPRFFPHRFGRLPHWPGLLARIAEARPTFDPHILECPASSYLNGYWQTEKYFASIAGTLRADFALLQPMTAARQSLAGQMTEGESVSVHVRRGDYVTNANANLFHGTCSPEWYAQAMAKMAVEVPRAKFFVFSDDPVWARENLPKFDGMLFVDPQPDGRDYEDMHLMAKCRHHIIANSSYSWWGAWLNPSPAKKVIAPLRWFLVETDTSDRIPSSWMRL